MARRRQDADRDRFSTTEVAAGSGLSPRNVMYLCSEGLIPVTGGGHGRGSHRQLDYEGLARVAVIAAFYDAGIEIFLASKLIHEIANQASLHNLANLDSFLARPHSGIISMMSEDDLDPENAFYLHETLRRRSNNYTPHKGMVYDRLIEIFDRVYVFLNHLEAENNSGVLFPSNRPTALFKLEGWRRGSDRVEMDHAPAHLLGKLPSGWEVVRVNFKGMSRVNVSLAIRDALDAIAMNRGH